MRAGDSNAPVTDPTALRVVSLPQWLLIHVLPARGKVCGLDVFCALQKQLPSVVILNNFVRQNILNGIKLFVASDRPEHKFLVKAMRAH